MSRSQPISSSSVIERIRQIIFKQYRFASVSGLPVTMIDERRTTVDAHRILTETGVFGKKRKACVDAVAASLILEVFMGRRG